MPTAMYITSDAQHANNNEISWCREASCNLVWHACTAGTFIETNMSVFDVQKSIPCIQRMLDEIAQYTEGVRGMVSEVQTGFGARSFVRITWNKETDAHAPYWYWWWATAAQRIVGQCRYIPRMTDMLSTLRESSAVLDHWSSTYAKNKAIEAWQATLSGTLSWRDIRAGEGPADSLRLRGL